MRIYIGMVAVAYEGSYILFVSQYLDTAMAKLKKYSKDIGDDFFVEIYEVDGQFIERVYVDMEKTHD